MKKEEAKKAKEKQRETLKNKQNCPSSGENKVFVLKTKRGKKKQKKRTISKKNRKRKKIPPQKQTFQLSAKMFLYWWGSKISVFETRPKRQAPPNTIK